MSRPPQTYFQFPLHLDSVIREIENGQALHFNVDHTDGVSELILLALPRGRFLIGRRNHGAIVIERMEDLCELFNTPSGENDLSCTRGDSLYLIPPMMMIFSKIGDHWRMKSDDDIDNLPLLPLNIPNAPAYLQHLLSETRDKNIIEFRVNGAVGKGLTVVVTRTWATGEIFPVSPEISAFENSHVHWSPKKGFCVAICGVGCWVWNGGAVDDHYMDEKLSLYRMRSMGYSLVETTNLLKVLRALGWNE